MKTAMGFYAGAAWERAMKREEIILRAYAKKISWIQAAEVLGISCRHLLRVREKYAEWGFDGLHDARVGKQSPRRVPMDVVEEVLRLYRGGVFRLQRSSLSREAGREAFDDGELYMGQGTLAGIGPGR